MKEIKLSERQRKCLEVLAEDHDTELDCKYIRYIAAEAGLEYREARIAVRALARKGLTEYVRGLFDLDGMVAGSGYRATFAGALLIRGCKKCRVSLSDMNDGTCQRCWEERRCKKCGKPYREHQLVNGYMEEFEEVAGPFQASLI